MIADFDDPRFASPLDRWLRVRNVTARRLAALAGVHESTICRIRTGQQTPTPELEHKIRMLTGLKRI